jgi:hypothetical protein
MMLAVAILIAAPACAAAPADDPPDDDTATTTTAPGTDDSSGTAGTDAGSDDAGTDDSASDTTGVPGQCAGPLGSGDAPIFQQPPGRFALRVVDDYKTLRGSVSDGPRLEFHGESARDGACRLLTYAASTCDPECTAPALCIAGTCVTEAGRLSAGALTLGGVGDDGIAVNEDGLHEYFWDGQGGPAPTMPTLTAAGADVPAFDLAVCPSTAATPDGDWSALLAARAPGEAVLLTWSDPLDDARIYLRMTTGIATHGGISPVEIECEGPDVGALELPGDFLDALYADGWACGECGGNDLIRYYADQSDDGGVQFRSESVTNFWFIP